jgi:hypothetical protein
MEWGFSSLTTLRRLDLLGLAGPSANLGSCVSLSFIVWHDRGSLPTKRGASDQGSNKSKEGDSYSI